MAYNKSKNRNMSVTKHGYNWWSDVIPKRTQDKKNKVYGGKDNFYDQEMSTRSNNNLAGVELMIATPDGQYICSSQEVYTDSSNIIQEISAGTQGTTSELTTLTEFSKNLAALTAHSAKTLLIKNNPMVNSILL